LAVARLGVVKNPKLIMELFLRGNEREALLLFFIEGLTAFFAGMTLKCPG
jgi:hypothetical protein